MQTINLIVCGGAREAISMKCCEPKGFPRELAPIDSKAVSAMNQLVEPFWSEQV